MRLKVLLIGFLLLVIDIFVIFANYMEMVTKSIYTLLNTAKEMLIGEVLPTAIRPGQIRVVVTSLKAPFGPPLKETDKVDVTLTLDAGAEDIEVKAQEGSKGLRRGPMLRLVEEALEQGGVLTQDDLARMLKVSNRTIRRDVRDLKAEGHVI